MRAGTAGIAFILLAILLMGQSTMAQDIPQVPDKLDFAGIRLELSSHVQKEIQTEVNALMRSPTYFQLKVDRFASYHPIIERVFIEEGLPADFKFLTIQESGLVSDAVSSSNAVGFWQFKAPTAREVGLRVDDEVDERMNIVASSRGAARYLKNNNARLDNWTYALLSYMTGLGGVQSYVDRKYVGKTSMKLEKGTHWYIIKLLSHKIAFEHEDVSNPTVKLVEYVDGGGLTLDQIARETKSDPQLVADYNKWLKTRKVPTDREYTVILPVDASQMEQILAEADVRRADVPQQKAIRERLIRDADNAITFEWNNIDAVIASSEDTKNSLALVGDLSKRRFMRFNDMNPRDEVSEGQVYYLERKRRKAKVPFHTLQPEESLWEVSQKYGIRLKQLRRRSRLKKGQAVQPGTVLWLRNRRKKDEPLKVEKVQLPKTVVRPEEVKVKAAPIPKPSPTESQPSETKSKGSKLPVPEPAKPVAIETKSVPVEPPMSDQPDGISGSGEDNPQRSVVLEDAGEPDANTMATTLIHTVQQGETLYGISKIYGVKVEQLIHWNRLEGGQLAIGQTLRVSELKETEPIPKKREELQAILHEVKPGETLYQISKKYATTVEEILKLNKKGSTQLSVGEKLQIPRSEN